MNTSNKKNLFGLLRVLAFLMVFLLFFQVISVVFVPKGGYNSSEWTKYTTKAYIGERQNSIDVLLIGNSNLYRGFSPIDCWNAYGISCCDAGKPSQTAKGGYNTLRNAFRYQHPKVVVLETDMLLVNYIDLGMKMIFTPEPDAPKPSIYDGIKKIDEKFDSFYPKLIKTGFNEFFDKTDTAFETEINYYFPLLKYHDRWNSLQKNDFRDMNAVWHFADKGFVRSAVEKPYAGSLEYMTANAKNSDAVKGSNLKYLDKMTEFCKENQIKFILLSLPSAKSWSVSKHNALADFAAANKLDYIDLNLTEMNTGLNWLTDTYDGGTHLNIYGAKKATAAFGEYLNKNLQLPDHRNDSAYAQWAEDVKHINNQ